MADKDTKHRVQKLLSNYGVCSRRTAEELIKEGKVKVNGKVISIGDKASETDKITVKGKPVSKKEKIHILFNKPVGCVTALKDKEFKTVIDYIDIKERIFPIGRLDYNTSGMLIMTNDGDFANKVMHPRYETKKTYAVELHKQITNKEIQKIEAGVMLDDGKTSKAVVKKHSPVSLDITIHEGKKRIVRRIFSKLGFKILSLERIRIGKLGLGDLKPGRYRKLSKSDMDKIFS